MTTYFIGFAFGGLMYGLPDRYGRKRAVQLGLFMSCFAQTVMLLSNSFAVRSAMFFIMGLASIKNTVSGVWLSECVSFRYKPTAHTMINAFDALPIAIVCLTYMFITRYWLWVCLAGTILTYVATVASFFCPESPRWHLNNGRTADAIDTLNKIAEMNSSEEKVPTNAIFVEDPTNFEVKECQETRQRMQSFKMTPLQA